MKHYYFSAENSEQLAQNQLDSANAKKGYKKPALVAYGLVANLTQAGSNGGTENGGYNMMGVYKLMGMMGYG